MQPVLRRQGCTLRAQRDPHPLPHALLVRVSRVARASVDGWRGPGPGLPHLRFSAIGAGRAVASTGCAVLWASRAWFVREGDHCSQPAPPALKRSTGPVPPLVAATLSRVGEKPRITGRGVCYAPCANRCVSDLIVGSCCGLANCCCVCAPGARDIVMSTHLDDEAEQHRCTWEPRDPPWPGPLWRSSARAWPAPPAGAAGGPTASAKFF